VTDREATAKRRRLGCEEVRRRGWYRRWVTPATGGRTTLPDWGPRDREVGMRRAAVRALGLVWQAFGEASQTTGERVRDGVAWTPLGDDMWVKLTRDDFLLEARHEGGHPPSEAATPEATPTSRASNRREILNWRAGQIRHVKQEGTRHGCVR
jgi:hypothetical protein